VGGRIEEAGEVPVYSDAAEDEAEAAAGGSDAAADGDGFVVADCYLSEDELAIDPALASGAADGADAGAAAFGSPARGAPAAEDAAEAVGAGRGLSAMGSGPTTTTTQATKARRMM